MSLARQSSNRKAWLGPRVSSRCCGRFSSRRRMGPSTCAHAPRIAPAPNARRCTRTDDLERWTTLSDLADRIGNKIAGQLVRSEDWDMLVDAVDATNARIDALVQSSCTVHADPGDDLSRRSRRCPRPAASSASRRAFLARRHRPRHESPARRRERSRPRDGPALRDERDRPLLRDAAARSRCGTCASRAGRQAPGRKPSI